MSSNTMETGSTQASVSQMKNTLSPQVQQFQQKIQKLGESVEPVTGSESQRLLQAKNVFLKNFGRRMAVDLEACLHCGMCAEVCHFYESTLLPKYTPIQKVKPLKRFYRRELSPLRWLHRLFTRDLSLEELADWQELVFDSCTECGRCDLVCPMGIEISAMVALMRQGLTAADLAPDELRELDKEQAQNGTLLGIGKQQLKDVVAELVAQGIDIPMDKKTADVMLLSSTLDILLFKKSLAGTAKILNRLGVSWTLQSDCFEAANFGFISGDDELQRIASESIITVATACQAKTVLLPECGHAYPALRWEGATKHHDALPFEVMAISEFIGQEIVAGRLKVNNVGMSKKVTYHDPCQLGRHGGIFDEPREALNALGVDFYETESHARSNYCCGGGSGVFLLKRAAPLRQRAFEIKMREVDKTGADSVVTSCDSCRVNFMVGAANANWDKPVESLVELVAANLAD